AFIYGYFKKNDLIDQVANVTVFKSIFSIFPEVASRIKDRYGPDYTTDNYMEIMSPMFSKINNQRIKKPGTSYKTLANYLSSCMKSDFTL
ncbi:hypothetical protein D9K24_24085, partial [Escherichia coli]|nr:hypothetical protein [Escherichia coli]